MAQQLVAMMPQQPETQQAATQTPQLVATQTPQLVATQTQQPVATTQTQQPVATTQTQQPVTTTQTQQPVAQQLMATMPPLTSKSKLKESSSFQTKNSTE